MRRLTPVVLVLLVCAALGAGCGRPPSDESGTLPKWRPRPADPAARYEGVGTVLENKPGPPQLCFAVAESYPPQCGGIALVGWDWANVDGEESSGATTWIDAVRVVGTYADRTLTLTEPPGPAPARRDARPPADTDFAPACERPDLGSGGREGAEEVDVEPLGERLVSVWVTEPDQHWTGPFVLNVVVRPGASAEARRLVRSQYKGALCTVEADRPSRKELERIQEDISREHDHFGLVSGGVDEVRSVVRASVYVATDDLRAEARRRWGDRVILEGLLRPVG